MKGRRVTVAIVAGALLLLALALVGEAPFALWLRVAVGQILGLIGRMAIWLIILAVVLVVGLRLWRSDTVGRTGNTRPRKPRPLDVLRRRFERGEITREQYEQMRRDLGV